MQVSATKGEGMDLWINWIRLHAVTARHARDQMLRTHRRVADSAKLAKRTLGARAYASLTRWTAPPPLLSRRAVRVRGQVQGVGFRPFVYRLAQDLALSGRVLNDGMGVQIEVQGAAAQLDAFVAAPRARSAAAGAHRRGRVATAEPRTGGVAVSSSTASGGGPIATGVTPDSAPCPDCLADCSTRPTAAGATPSLTAPTAARATRSRQACRTTDRTPAWRALSQCPACQREYDDPDGSPLSCAAQCLPGVRPAAVDCSRPTGARCRWRDPIADTIAAVCSPARSSPSRDWAASSWRVTPATPCRRAAARTQVAGRKALRGHGRQWATCSCSPTYDAERALLESAERPIVLLPQQTGCDTRCRHRARA